MTLVSRRNLLSFAAFGVVALSHPAPAADGPGLHFSGKEGAGKGKRVVLMAGDEEYRSEESLPMLAKLLSERH
ncbi:MAG: hypothetical protein KDL87_19200, partial [Verrucomicrobiae bacterium]|nr:hypothetical protein [Verrucomicrobiae bacterium]